MTHDCLFCKIVNKEMDTQFLFEDDAVVVFRDINPQAPVHLLIVPKKHIRSINDLTEEDEPIVGRMCTIAKQMAEKEGIAKTGYNLIFNVEKGGGQVIFHLHMHLMGQKT